MSRSGAKGLDILLLLLLWVCLGPQNFPAATATALFESDTAAMRLYRSCVLQEQQRVQDRPGSCKVTV
jgi:hypothetical protein